MSMSPLSRRSLLRGGVAGAVATVFAPAVWTSAARASNNTLTVGDVGGKVAPGLKAAFYEPFEKETGIKIVSVAQDPSPVTQFKLLVDTKSYIWDVSMTTPDHVASLSEDKQYCAELNLGIDPADYVDDCVTSNWLGFTIFGVAMAYNKETLPGPAPKTWADYWNVADFPGRRGLYKDPWGTLELALLADGVAPADLYPLDVDRAFASLDKIREHVAVWWTSGAHNTQILQSGEVDLSDTWSARVFAARDAGAPLETVWQGLYSVDGWAVPAGTPRFEAAQEFVKFCARPEQQAILSMHVANGPSAKKAYDFIPEERAKLLPTYSENVKGLRMLDAAYWGKNRPALLERFNEWLLAG